MLGEMMPPSCMYGRFLHPTQKKTRIITTNQMNGGVQCTEEGGDKESKKKRASEAESSSHI